MQAGWAVDDLSLPASQQSQRAPPSEQEVRQMLAALQAEWADGGEDLVRLTEWSLERFRLPADGSFSFQQFEAAFLARRYQFKQLVNYAHKLNLFQDAHDVIDAAARVERVMCAAYQTCFRSFVQFNTMESSRLSRIPPEVVQDETCLFHDSQSLSSFQRLLLHLLKRIEAKSLLKCGDACFARRLTASGYPTLAYEYVHTIKEEVWLVKKEVSWEMWKLFTNPRDNARAVTEHLVESTQEEFPTFEVGEGHWYSFENGVYNIKHDLFFAYGEEADWKERADEMAAHRGVVEYPHPTDATVCVNHFSIPFRFDISPATDDPVSFDPYALPTPSIDKIFSLQKFEEETCRQLLGLIGRLHFLVNAEEMWKRALIFQGAGGTGKSTIIKWVAHTVPPHFHSIMNANFEEKFGMSGLLGEEKRLCICEEMTNDMSVKQEEWQIFVEGGTLQPAVKGVTARPSTVKQHIVMAGNQFPRRWNNNGKQISRRSWLVIFKYLVKKSAVQPNLLEEMKLETDALLRKCTCLYARMVRAYGNQDLEAPGVMPDQVREFMQTLEVSIDPLTSFLQRECFAFGYDRYMPLEDFKKLYFEFRKDNGFGSVAWTKDSYESTFQSMELFVQRNTLDWEGVQRTTDYIIGIEVVDPSC